MSLESVFRLSLIMNLIDNLTGPMAGVTSSVDGTVSKLQKVNSTLGSVAKTGAVMQEVGSQITGGGAVPGRGHLRDKTGDRRAGLPGRERPRGGRRRRPGVLRPMGRNHEGRLHRGGLRHQKRHRDALGRGRRGVHKPRGPDREGDEVHGGRDDLAICHGLRHL